MNTTRILEEIGVSLRGFVHESARGDSVLETRHFSFIVSHLSGGLMALSAFPLYLALAGKPGLIESLVFIWLLSPIAVVAYLSRTGKLAMAHLLSAASLTGLVMFVAALTGGVDSFLVVWLVAVPVEASLSASRRVVLAAILMAGAAFALLFFLGQAGMLPVAHTFALSAQSLSAIGVISVLVYVGGIAMSVEAFHQETEKAIRQGEARYRLLAENTTDMISRHSHNGHTLFVSHAGSSLLGVDVGSLTGDGLFEHVHIMDRPAFLMAISNASATGKSTSVECRMRKHVPDRETTEYIWTEMRCRPVSSGQDGSGGGRGGIVAVTRDISLAKKQELELLRARDLAEKANIAKSRFLANISHELRTPLNAIIGFSSILNQDLFGRMEQERHREYAQLINQSGEHLLQVVNDLLDMSKIEAGKYDLVKERFDLAKLVESVCRIMETSAGEAGLELVADTGNGNAILTADKRACKQILINLLSNAVKFGTAGTQITVGIRREAAMLAISIQDRGIGMSAEDLEKIGQPFIQADSAYDRKYEGTGLGLSIVKGLAYLHGGSVDIQSALGEGTCVTVRLPLEDAGENGEKAEADVDARPGDTFRLRASA